MALHFQDEMNQMYQQLLDNGVKVINDDSILKVVVYTYKIGDFDWLSIGNPSSRMYQVMIIKHKYPTKKNGKIINDFSFTYQLLSLAIDVKKENSREIVTVDTFEELLSLVPQEHHKQVEKAYKKAKSTTKVKNKLN